MHQCDILPHAMQMQREQERALSFVHGTQYKVVFMACHMHAMQMQREQERALSFVHGTQFKVQAYESYNS